jgi:hypothetical protein
MSVNVPLSFVLDESIVGIPAFASWNRTLDRMSGRGAQDASYCAAELQL